MQRGRNYRQVPSYGFAPNYQIHHRSPNRIKLFPDFVYAGVRQFSFETPQSENVTLMFSSGVLDWRGVFSRGIYDFSYHFQQRVLPGSTDMEFSLLMVDNFGGALAARYLKDPGFIVPDNFPYVFMPDPVFNASMGFFGPGGIDGWKAIGYHEEV